MTYYSISKVQIIIAGLATFAMFFGSGNLVFPIIIGSQSQSQWLIASLGLAVTGVFLPFLGLLAMVYLNGSQDRFFRWTGKIGAWIIPLLILLLIGPFGVIPRCITVAFGAWQSFLPSTPLWIFTLLTLIIVWFATRGEGKIVGIIGKYFTPIKLTALAIVILGSIYFTLQKDQINPTTIHSTTTFYKSFYVGFLEGYHTMDLMAAIFFGVSIVDYFKHIDNKEVSKKPTIIAIAVGMILLAVVYAALVYLGSAYSTQISSIPTTRMLPTIAKIAMGSASDYLISSTLVIACMTTAVALTAVSTQFLTEKIFFLKGKRKITLFLCLIFSFIFALTGFTGITSFLAPILMWIYPILILLAIVNIVNELFKKNNQNKIHNKEIPLKKLA